MTANKTSNYRRVESAIAFLRNHVQNQPSLDEVAGHVGVSPQHFQRIFKDWAGVSPKKFLQYLSVEHAKGALKDRRASILHTSFETGLSGPSRLHDLFVSVEAMTPGEYKKGGENLTIHYNFVPSPFGEILIGSTSRGVCCLSFVEEGSADLRFLRELYPNATLHHQSDEFQEKALSIFDADWSDTSSIKLHLAGTPFQLKVWQSLLSIPSSSLTTYGAIAEDIKKPKACRAVGTAVGRNPVSFIIPCHRVIQQSGILGNYRWGPARKAAMIGWESAK